MSSFTGKRFTPVHWHHLFELGSARKCFVSYQHLLIESSKPQHQPVAVCGTEGKFDPHWCCHWLMYSYDARQLEIAMLSRSLPKLVHTLERLWSVWSYGYGRSFAIGPRNHPVSTKDSCTKNIESLQRFLFSIWFQLLCWYSNKSEIPLLLFWVGLVVLVLSFVPPLVLLCLFVCLLGQFFRCLELFVHAGCFFVFWGVSFSLFSCLLHLSAS